jgi:hypothetical protein
MKKTSFKLRKEPVKPVRKKNIKYTRDLYDGDNLGCLSGWLDEHNATLDDITIEKEWGYYDEVSIFASICTDELEEDFQRRVVAYEKSKKKYDAWYKANKKTIEIKLEQRKKEEAEKKKRQKEALKKRKEKEKIKLEKQIKMLNNKLKKMK